MNILNVEKVSKTYGEKELFNNISLGINSGDKIGLIGVNGTGKSTLLKIIAGVEEPDEGQVVKGKGIELAYLAQTPLYYDNENVLEYVMRGKHADSQPKAKEILNKLGITNHGAMMNILSGGQKKRAALARTLVEPARLLILDEPTNHLDLDAIAWLEEFLINFENTVIVVSHDRHFLNQVCTHIADVDFGKIQLYVGNYDFWYHSSQLALQLAKDANKKKEEKIKELQTFIARFAANASKSKQATSRKKLLDKITLDDIKPSSRRYPYIAFTPDREAGDQLLLVEGISKTIDGEKVLNNVSFTVRKGDKIAFTGPNSAGKTALFQILMGEMEPDEGSFKWGVTTTQAYLPNDNTEYFEGCELSLTDWLRQYSKDPDESFVRGFLGRMLFSGEESLKQASVISGGEKVRCMLSKMMLSGANVLLMDEPTNHLDLESITALNDGLINFKGTLLFVSHDHQFVQTIADRIIELTPEGVFDKLTSYDDFLADEDVQARLAKMYEA